MGNTLTERVKAGIAPVMDFWLVEDVSLAMDYVVNEHGFVERVRKLAIAFVDLFGPFEAWLILANGDITAKEKVVTSYFDARKASWEDLSRYTRE